MISYLGGSSQMAAATDEPDEQESRTDRANRTERREPEVEEAFDRLVSEGSDRLARPLIPLVATGFMGGIDVGVGVLAYLVVDHETGQPLLAAAVFPIGFIALLLARSELFTENFLVPVTARVAGHGSWLRLLRLWLVTLAANLAGGLVMAGLIVVALPDLRPPWLPPAGSGKGVLDSRVLTARQVCARPSKAVSPRRSNSWSQPPIGPQPQRRWKMPALRMMSCRCCTGGSGLGWYW
jgi:hypothetical protein